MFVTTRADVPLIISVDGSFEVGTSISIFLIGIISSTFFLTKGSTTGVLLCVSLAIFVGDNSVGE